MKGLEPAPLAKGGPNIRKQFFDQLNLRLNKVWPSNASVTEFLYLFDDSRAARQSLRGVAKRALTFAR